MYTNSCQFTDRPCRMTLALGWVATLERASPEELSGQSQDAEIPKPPRNAVILAAMNARETWAVAAMTSNP